MRDEAIDFARFAPQGRYLPALLTRTKGAWGLKHYELGLHQLVSRPTFFIPNTVSISRRF